MNPTIALLNRLRHFVRTEAQTQFDALIRQWSRPLAERVAKGYAIEGLNIERIHKSLIQLNCKTNNSRFREGDLLVLHSHNPQDPNALHVELQYDGGTELEVSLISGNPIFLSANPQGWIIDQDWFDSSPFYLEALNTVADSLRGRSIILPLLQRTLTSKIDYARYERTAQDLQEMGLNESQIEAVSQAYASDLLYMIQGPPGTGKTLMLAYLARLLANDGQRVLVTALTHRAIHNALNKIFIVDDDLPVCKIGGSQHISDLDVPNFETFDLSLFGDLNDGYIIGATPFSIQTQRLANVEFDVVLFDEASQITLPLAIMGMLAGNKYIFIGDENQLPPVTILSEKEAAQTSIFDYLSGIGNETMLNITYRLNDVLTDWPNKTFYQGKLKTSEEASKRRLILSSQSTHWDFVLDPSSPAVFLDLCHRNTTIRSHREAETIIELILALLVHGISPDAFGVVVPFRAQSRLIRSLLRRTIENEEIWSRIVVDTVERMQGQEREVILISFTTASPSFASQMADFLFQPQRLNVAVTRPRSKLILVGSHHMLEGEQISQNHAEHFSLLRDLIDTCLVITLPDGLLE
ncbi:MAG: AAA family ATPase [Anaerolineaceae bacterium]|nr:AAA family ATPase [Anaerolineaceae bacterium]